MSTTRPALFCISLISALPFSATAQDFEQLSLHGRGEFYLNKQNDTAHYLAPWWQKGTGQFGHHTDAGAGPQYLVAQLETYSDFSAIVHAQWHRAPEAGIGVTEAWLNWSPLPRAGYRIRGRAGVFYPAMSLENTDLAAMFLWDERTFLRKTEGGPLRRAGYERFLRNLAVGWAMRPPRFQ